MDLKQFSRQYDHLLHDVSALKRAICNKLVYQIAKNPQSARSEDWLHAVSYAVRDHLVGRWMETIGSDYEQDVKRVFYLSMEFLIGRTFSNAMLALDLMPTVRQALHELDVDLDELLNLEPDAALGNGGLGRLAACFLDSMATQGIPGFGYGIRYDYGMFRQRIVDGQQVEVPDYWMTHGNPWEFQRPEIRVLVRYGGRLEEDGNTVRWVDTEDVLAMAYDQIIPGYGTKVTNTLRLWSAKATEEINLSAFNQGNYFGAVESKNYSENVSRVLYPDDSTLHGRELRLRQEYFFVSASLQDIVRRYQVNHQDFDALPDKVSIHLNDTHPVLAIPELMRLLVDEHKLAWKHAWSLCQRVFSYTNHTLMQEALETWPVSMLGRVLPRHLRIIFDINADFLESITAVHGHDTDLMRRVSLVDESGERYVRMAYLAVVASHSVNGVSALHSELMKTSIFRDFARLWPERFNNKTNGVTPRRWLAQANPGLAALIDERLGPDWRRQLELLHGLRDYEHDTSFMASFRAIKRANKERLAAYVQKQLCITLNPDAMFDVHVKRMHEYKRQLLNVLHVVTRYQAILANPGADWVPRVVIFAGKSASAYYFAKLVIRLINDVAATVNNDPRIGDRLKVVFIPNYRVSLAELIIPAADLSEQISTAGTEASGTGNMKLALNGALTIGTLDGANVEIREQVGADNIFIFGNTTDQVAEIRAGAYRPRAIYEADPQLKAALDAIRDGHFSPQQPDRYRDIYDALVNHGDHYLLLADYASYVATQHEVDAVFRQPAEWSRRALLNVAGMGEFSSDRTILEYARTIWNTPPALPA
ncbi:glycogen/starch/alpha-glucan phosphorylase [Zoogloea sp.]|uniref:glycogen/starch/alpha-glucan phosphorylase n=1 Tax=Zoogloea sp. TaxID=49181 RepID=UPI002635D095|nr:glycogen/starch/alpha-glucan phosphorylase [uncultured Zoogloea sp.]